MLKVHDTLRSHYQIEAVQDQNALRTAYRAKDKWGSNRSVMVSEYAVPPQDAAQFNRQLAALRGLHHNSLPHVRDVFEMNGQHYLVTDAVEGQTLATLIQSGVSLGDAQKYIGQIAEALAVCHRAGVIHRDVRPQNIIISAGRAVLVNFGLMKLMLDDGLGTALGTAQFIKGWGTPAYTAPEQYGVGTDERSDIYALGATLYYALTRTEPVPAPMQMSGEPLPAPSRLVSGIPDHLEKAIEKAMSLDAGQRFESALAFKDALVGVVNRDRATRPIQPLGAYQSPVISSVTPMAMNNGSAIAADDEPVAASPQARPQPAYAAVRAPGPNADSVLDKVPDWLKAVVAALVVVALVTVAVLAVEVIRNGSAAGTPAPSANASNAGAEVRATTATPRNNAPTARAPVATVQVQTQPAQPVVATALPLPTVAPQVAQPTQAPPQPQASVWQEESFSIGSSVLGQTLTVYKLGDGPVRRVLIGAIHGGYEWNTANLMSKTLEHLRQNRALIPPQVTVYILPIANPDGYARSKDLAGRVNANGVDLNRNWDYMWQMTATHGTRPIPAGKSPFSEPEAAAMRDWLVDKLKLQQPHDAVIFYHSAFTAIFAGAGKNTLTDNLAQAMQKATGYRILPGVQGQITTGDSIDYLTDKANITAIEVELRNHQDIDWPENLRGLNTFLNWNLPDVPQTVIANPQATAIPISPASSNTQPFATRQPTSNCPQPYKLKPGELLGDVALKCDVSVESIAKANGITDPNFVKEGQELIIPSQ